MLVVRSTRVLHVQLTECRVQVTRQEDMGLLTECRMQVTRQEDMGLSQFAAWMKSIGFPERIVSTCTALHLG